MGPRRAGVEQQQPAAHWPRSRFSVHYEGELAEETETPAARGGPFGQPQGALGQSLLCP